MDLRSIAQDSDRAGNFVHCVPGMFILIVACAEELQTLVADPVFLMHNPSGHVLRDKKM